MDPSRTCAGNFPGGICDESAIFHSGKRTPSNNGQLVVLDRNVEPVLIHSEHLDFESVTVTGFNHTRRWRKELLSLRAIATTIFTGQSIHGENSFQFQF